MQNKHPWLSIPLSLSRAVLDAVDRHALREYPNESCGFLTGSATDAGKVDRAIEAINLADKYHKVDPETFPRTAREYYTIDARVIERTFREGEEAAQPVKVIYHSHCDCGAYFSQTDQDAAAPDGQLAYPVTYLVTSVMDGKIADHRLYSFVDGRWTDVSFVVS
jgi:proteasome lid subunit RPN8/RPN11